MFQAKITSYEDGGSMKGAIQKFKQRPRSQQGCDRTRTQLLYKISQELSTPSKNITS